MNMVVNGQGSRDSNDKDSKASKGVEVKVKGIYLSKSKGNEESRGRTRKVGRKPTKFRDSRDQTKETRKRKKVGVVLIKVTLSLCPIMYLRPRVVL